MKEQVSQDILEQLFVRVERAWFDHHDRTLVYELSKEHPELRNSLLEFFEDLILGPGVNRSPEVIEADIRVHEWLRSSGFEIAANAASKLQTTDTSIDNARRSLDATSENAVGNEKAFGDADKTWLLFLRRYTKQRVAELAKALPHMTTEYLVLVSRHPNVVPPSVRNAMALYTEKALGVPARESLKYLSRPAMVVRAASRSSPYDKELSTFEDLLDRSGLTKEQRAFWAGLGNQT